MVPAAIARLLRSQSAIGIVRKAVTKTPASLKSGSTCTLLAKSLEDGVRAVTSIQ